MMRQPENIFGSAGEITNEKHLVLWAALLPLATQAAALSCKHFEYEDLAPERDAVLKKYENRDVEKLSAKESTEFN